VCGYCYISRYKPRQAYDRTAEITIYLKPEFWNKGIGKETIRMLEQVAKQNGICVLIGVITGENLSALNYLKNAAMKNVRIISR
jgi:L-amino acid N-acyltransferase YncA